MEERRGEDNERKSEELRDEITADLPLKVEYDRENTEREEPEEPAKDPKGRLAEDTDQLNERTRPCPGEEERETKENRRGDDPDEVPLRERMEGIIECPLEETCKDRACRPLCGVDEATRRCRARPRR